MQTVNLGGFLKNMLFSNILFYIYIYVFFFFTISNYQHFTKVTKKILLNMKIYVPEVVLLNC